MDTLQEEEALQNLPLREDGTIDLMELGRRQLEAIVNQIMDWQADELCGGGNCRDGHRKHQLLTPVGEITLRIPKLREGTYFSDELIRPYSRVDRAVVAVVKEACVRGLSTRKIEKAANALEFASLSPSRVSRMTADLDEVNLNLYPDSIDYRHAAFGRPSSLGQLASSSSAGLTSPSAVCILERLYTTSMSVGRLAAISPSFVTRQAQCELFPTSSPSTALRTVTAFGMVSSNRSVDRMLVRATPTLLGRGAFEGGPAGFYQSSEPAAPASATPPRPSRGRGRGPSAGVRSAVHSDMAQS
jgi:hypothetical protein